MDFKRTILLAFGLCLMATLLPAQDIKFPSMDKSPMDAAHYPRQSAYLNYMPEDQLAELQPKIKVLYSRPQKKDREVFGALVPYGKEWRLGANESTEVRFYQAVEIGGVMVPPGAYTMFADVSPSHWTVKISKERFIAGNSNRDASKDVVHVAIPVTTEAESTEAFTIGFQRVDDDACNMVFKWDRTKAVLPISFNPTFMDSELNASPMDLAAYPANSRTRNFVKEEEFEASAPKIRVVYSRPQMKGRKIFGELLKYGELWRAGANETTEVTFFQDVMINGKEVKAGTYGLTLKVHDGKWDFIVHTNLPSWGFYNHDDSKNVVVQTSPTAKTKETLEAMAVTFEKVDDKNVNLILGWEDTMAKLPIQMK
ncbi:MAG: DUF2911 domain-containing protein [Bacteroidota bacterium]